MRRTTTLVAAWVTVLLLIGAALLGAASLLTLSGCLTAAKIGQWQRAVYGWSMDESSTQACRDAAALAGKHIATANTDLLGTGKLTDLASDSRARELVTSAALACGKVAP